MIENFKKERDKLLYEEKVQTLGKEVEEALLRIQETSQVNMALKEVLEQTKKEKNELIARVTGDHLKEEKEPIRNFLGSKRWFNEMSTGPEAENKLYELSTKVLHKMHEVMQISTRLEVAKMENFKKEEKINELEEKVSYLKSLLPVEQDKTQGSLDQRNNHLRSLNETTSQSQEGLSGNPFRSTEEHGVSGEGRGEKRTQREEELSKEVSFLRKKLKILERNLGLKTDKEEFYITERNRMTELQREIENMINSLKAPLK